jgi:hypothetical protein
VNGRTPPPAEEPPGPVEEAPPTATVVVDPPLLLVAPEVEVVPGVVVVGLGPQPVTQKTFA